MLWDKLRRQSAGPLSSTALSAAAQTPATAGILQATKSCAHPKGHFYSPVVNVADTQTLAHGDGRIYGGSRLWIRKFWFEPRLSTVVERMITHTAEAMRYGFADSSADLVHGLG
jgi:hypothetical protein